MTMKKKLKLSVVILCCLILTGCASKSELMLRKSKEKRVNLAPTSIKKIKRYSDKLRLKPSSVSVKKDNVKIQLRHLNENKLEEFFSSEKRFGDFAGSNPYFKDILVFYIKIKNSCGNVIKVNPEKFVIVDDLNSQYSYMNPDYIISLYKVRSSMYSFTKTTGNFAPGGLYGAPVDVASSLAGRRLDQKRIQLKTVELAGGYIHDGVTYDGLISFFKPSRKTSKLKLLLPDIKTRFNPKGEALKEINFVIPFDIMKVKGEEE